MKKNIEKIVREYLSIYGEHTLIKELESKLDIERPDTLTVICNKDVHAIPDSVIRGEEFVFSRGHVDLSNDEAIINTMSVLLSKLAAKLKERSWKDIYIVPSGHPLFYAHAKYMIYRVTRIEATDVVYSGEGHYVDVKIRHRPIIAQARKKF